VPSTWEIRLPANNTGHRRVRKDTAGWDKESRSLPSSPETSCKLSSGFRYRIRYRAHHPAQELLRQLEHRFARKTTRVLRNLAATWPFLRLATVWEVKQRFRRALRVRSTAILARTFLDRRQLLRTTSAAKALILIGRLEHRFATIVEIMLLKEHARHPFVRPLTVSQLKELWNGDPRNLLNNLIDWGKLRAVAREERRRAALKLSRLDNQDPEETGETS